MRLRRCPRQASAVAIHRLPSEVAVRLALPGGVELAAIGAGEALRVADDVAEVDSVPRHQPAGELDRGGELSRVADHCGVARADVLDADREPIETNGVATADVKARELVDRPVPVDDEVRAGSGQLAQLPVGRIRREGIPGGTERLVGGVVLHDRARPETPARGAVVATGIGGHLVEAARRHWHRLPANRRLRRRAMRFG